MVGVNGDELATLGFVRLPITIGGAMESVEFRVVPACPASVLLGTGALHQFGVGIQFEARVLALPGSRTVPFEVTASTATRYGVFLAEELVLDPRTVTRVHVRVAEGPTPWDADQVALLVEPMEWGNGLKTSRVARTVADAWRDADGKRWTMTDVANFSTRPIRLAAGTPLAEAEQVEDDWTCTIVDGGAAGQRPPTQETGTEVAEGSSDGEEGAVEAPYRNTLSWEPVAAATEKDIADMVNQADAGLSDEESGQLAALLMRNRDVFAPALLAPGQARHEPHRIEVDGHRPIKVAPRRVSPKELIVQKTEIGKMLGAGVVWPSHSPWASPVVLVTKKDGSTRFCVDYWGLNCITKCDSYPLPHVDDILDMLAGSVWRSSLDLVSGYWQIPVHEDDIEKMAFATQHGTFEFTVMPFGLTNALASFQCDMDIVLLGLNWVSTLVYIDDITVFSTSLDNHIQHLQEVFDWL